eukprot:11195741-Lingulodinium_polyedra.AAC.1
MVLLGGCMLCLWWAGPGCFGKSGSGVVIYGGMRSSPSTEHAINSTQFSGGRAGLVPSARGGPCCAMCTASGGGM